MFAKVRAIRSLRGNRRLAAHFRRSWRSPWPPLSSVSIMPKSASPRSSRSRNFTRECRGRWHGPDDVHPYKTVEYHETLVPGEPERFVDSRFASPRSRKSFAGARACSNSERTASRSGTISTTTRPYFSAIRPARYSKFARGRRSRNK